MSRDDVRATPVLAEPASRRIVTVADLQDERPDPGKAADVEAFFRDTGEQVADWVNSGRVVLVNCQAGRNRSAALCALALGALPGDSQPTFEVAMQMITDAAARTKFDENVPRSFLTTNGGEYFRESLGATPQRRSRRCRSDGRGQEPQSASKRQKGSYDEKQPYRLLLYSDQGSKQGQLWLGNLAEAKRAATLDTCDILNLSAKHLGGDTTVKMSNAAGVLRWLRACA